MANFIPEHSKQLNVIITGPFRDPAYSLKGEDLPLQVVLVSQLNVDDHPYLLLYRSKNNARLIQYMIEALSMLDYLSHTLVRFCQP